MGDDHGSPDVRQLDNQKLSQVPFPGDVSRDFRIFLDPETSGEINRHALEDTSVEICGVLVGLWHRDQRGPFVSISAAIPGEAASNKFAEVTFTHETWARINQRMDTDFRDRSIVGWYHTHPDFGIFLSERDRFIHEHFFNGAGQVAYVIDPIRKREGFFTWSKGQPIACEQYWVGSRVYIMAQDDQSAHDGGDQASANGHAQQSSIHSGDRRPTEWPWFAHALIAMGVFALGYLMASKMSQLDRLRLMEGTVAHYGLFKGLRPGLSESLDLLAANLAQTSADLQALSRGDSKAAGEEAAKIADQRRQIQGRLLQAQQYTLSLRDQFGLSREETAMLERLVAERTAALTALDPNYIAAAAAPSTQPAKPASTQSAVSPR